MSEIIKEMTERRARRAISEESIPREVLDRIFNAAILAPSCNNKQPWRFLVCTEGGAIGTAREALLGGNYWAQKAPVLVVAMTSYDLDCKLTDDRDYAWFDTGMAVGNLLLQATREGLYAHPMAGFDPFVLREKFNIGEETRIITMIAIGKPGESSHLNEKHLASETSERTRKPVEEVFSWEEWKGL
jgi:nitroreductase